MQERNRNEARMALLRSWLAARLDTERLEWLDGQIEKIGSGAPSALAMAIGLAPRKLGKDDLSPTEEEQRAAASLRPGLDASGWSVDQAARILFLLASFDGDEAAFAARLDELMTRGEIGEQIALLRGLPLYPGEAALTARAAEGVRSAVQPVFEAVAHANPYPQEQFSEDQWNQMVLKALFIGSKLAPIQGLDARRNADLAKMLVDYAHERWAAGRPVSPELWRGVGPFAAEGDIADLAKVLRDGSEAERLAAALALSESSLPSARSVLDTAPRLAADVRQGHTNWRDIH